MVGVRNQMLGLLGAVPTIFGDINGDGKVDIIDYTAVRKWIGTHCDDQQNECPESLGISSVIDLDMLLLRQQYGEPTRTPARRELHPFPGTDSQSPRGRGPVPAAAAKACTSRSLAACQR